MILRVKGLKASWEQQRIVEFKSYTICGWFTIHRFFPFLKNAHSAHPKISLYKKLFYILLSKVLTRRLQDFRYMKIHIFALQWRDEIKRSSQLRTLLKRVVVNRTWKKFRPVRDLNPWPLRYRCIFLNNRDLLWLVIIFSILTTLMFDIRVIA